MYRAHLPKALALAVLTAGLSLAGAQQPEATPDAGVPQAAPSGHHHAPNPQRQAAMLSKRLGLSPDQTTKLEPILAGRDQKLQALWQNDELTPQDRHQQMRSIHDETEQQLGGVLTPEQMTQFKAMHHRGHHHGQDAGAAGQTPTA